MKLHEAFHRVQLWCIIFIMYVNGLPNVLQSVLKYMKMTYCLAHNDLKQFELMLNSELIKVDGWIPLK